LARLDEIGAAAQRIVQHRRWIGEVGAIEDIVDLRPELDVADFINPELLVKCEIKLLHTEPVQRVAAQITEGARLGNCECGGIQKYFSLRGVKERIHTRDYARSAVATESATIGIVYDGDSVSRIRGDKVIGPWHLPDDIRAAHRNINGQTRTGIHDAPHFPSAEEKFRNVVAGAVRQRVKNLHVHAVAYVERVVAAVLLEVERILRRLGFVRSSGISEAVAVGPLETGRETSAEAAIEGGLQRIVVIRAAGTPVVEFTPTIPLVQERRNRCNCR